MRLVDSHAHLDEFDDLKPVISRAKRVGVVAIVAVGASLETNMKTLSIAEEYSGYVYPALGAHPWNISSKPEMVEENFRLMERRVDDVVAIGEVGLDFWIRADKELQVKVFRRVAEFAKRNRKPLLIHSRGAWAEAFEIVESVGVEDAVFHWYSGPEEVLEDILNSGYYISATPAAQYSRYHIKAVEIAPLDRMLLETDCPVVYRGVKSDPSFIVKTLEAVSAIKKVPSEEVAEKTTQNAIKLLKLPL